MAAMATARGGGGRAAATVKCGMGRLVAAADQIIHSSNGKDLAGRATQNKKNRTQLVHVSHAAPTRLIPMRLSSVERAGAAMCALSNYGGGMVQGDRSDLDVEVQRGATLGLVTQGCNRIYCPSPMKKENETSTHTSNYDITCRATLRARIARDGFLVLAPDPCVAFASSKFVQQQRIDVEDESSLVLVDWFGAGRVYNGERWDFSKLSSRTTLHQTMKNDGSDNDDNVPFLVEAVSFDRRRMLVGNNEDDDDLFSFNTGGLQFNAFCSIVLHGPQSLPVVARCKALEQGLAAKWTRIRRQEDSSTDDAECSNDQQQQQLLLDHNSLSGRVLLGVSKVSRHEEEERQHHDGTAATYVARLAATSNEDMYRILHSCLLPLASTFGMEFYKDRIQASATAVAATPAAMDQHEETQLEQETNTTSIEGGGVVNAWDRLEHGGSAPPISGHAAWCAYMLADSGLPTGGFAHSAGIEAASQLGMFGSSSSSSPDERRVSAYIIAATRSAAQLLTPFVHASHELIVGSSTEQPITAEAIHRQWQHLDRYAHACIASNAPACRASLDQGEGLLRVAMQWLQSSVDKKRQQHVHTAQALEVLHLLRQSLSGSAQQGHIGPIFGIVGAFLGLSSNDACHVLGFCAARDMVSAAVRLNLVGPLAGVGILNDAWNAVNDGVDCALASEMEKADLEGMSELLPAGVMSAAGCSPIADAIHPCHDLLSVRLFRT